MVVRGSGTAVPLWLGWKRCNGLWNNQNRRIVVTLKFVPIIDLASLLSNAKIFISLGLAGGLLCIVSRVGSSDQGKSRQRKCDPPSDLRMEARVAINLQRKVSTVLRIQMVKYRATNRTTVVEKTRSPSPLRQTYPVPLEPFCKLVCVLPSNLLADTR